MLKKKKKNYIFICIHLIVSYLFITFRSKMKIRGTPDACNILKGMLDSKAWDLIY